MSAITITRVRQFHDGDIWIRVLKSHGFGSPYALNDFFRLGNANGDQQELIESFVGDVLGGRCDPPSPHNPYMIEAQAL